MAARELPDQPAKHAYEELLVLRARLADALALIDQVTKQENWNCNEQEQTVPVDEKAHS